MWLLWDGQISHIALCRSLELACTNATPAQVVSCCQSLCTQLVSGDDDIRYVPVKRAVPVLSSARASSSLQRAFPWRSDVFSTGIQKVVAKAPPTHSRVAVTVLDRLVPAIRDSSNEASQLYLVRGVVAVVKRFGSTLSAGQHEAVLTALEALVGAT